MCLYYLQILLFYIRDLSIPEYQYPPGSQDLILWGILKSNCGNNHDILEGFLMADTMITYAYILVFQPIRQKLFSCSCFLFNFNFNLKIYPNDSFKWNKQEHSKM